jgi:hypothetical protein
MKLSAEYLEGLAAETGFRAATLEKVIRLGEVAADVSRHPLLSRVLALKGGTALNLMFGSPARLSVDLDFNYVGHEDRHQTQADRPDVERAVITIAGCACWSQDIPGLQQLNGYARPYRSGSQLPVLAAGRCPQNGSTLATTRNKATGNSSGVARGTVHWKAASYPGQGIAPRPFRHDTLTWPCG